MSDIDNKSGLAVYKRRVEHAVKWRRDAKYDETWAKLIKLYANRYGYEELSQYDDVIAPNMVFSTVNVIVPSVAVNYPKITVTARRPEDEFRAGVVEAVSNHNWRHFDVHDEFRRATKDFVIVGHGWLKTIWSFVQAERDWTPETFQIEAQNRLTERAQAVAQGVSAGLSPDEFPSEQEVLESIPEMQTYIKEDQPLVQRISPFDVFVDPDATNLKDARWIAHRMFVPIEVARSRKEWSPKARAKIRPTAMSEAKKDVDLTFEGEERGKDAEFAVVWEFYDLVNSKVCTFSDGCEDFLLKPASIPYAFGHPFVFIANYEVPDKFYPLGDVEVILPLQMELALTRTQLINDRKRYRRMYMYRPDDIGSDGVNAILSGDDNAMIEVTSDRPFAEMLAPVETSSLPPEIYNQTAMILDDVNLTTGVTEYQRGSMSEIRRTATEANMIQDGANARAADKLALIERGISKVAQNIVALAQQFLTSDQVAKIVGEDGQVGWMPYGRDDIAGEYDFEVEAGSTQPQNESFRRQSALQMMDAMAPFVSAGVVNPFKLAEHVLRNGFGVKNPAEFLMQMPPPMGGASPDAAQDPNGEVPVEQAGEPMGV